MIDCSDCETTHMGLPCGMRFIDRLRTVRLDTSVTPSRTLRNYYDKGPVAEVFGADSRERMYDATEGKGPAYQAPNGEFYSQDRHTGEATRLSDAELASYVDGPEEGP